MGLLRTLRRLTGMPIGDWWNDPAYGAEPPRTHERIFPVPASLDDLPLSGLHAFDDLPPMRRALLVLRPRAPFVHWVRSLGPQHVDYRLAQARRNHALALLLPARDHTHQEAQDFVSLYWPHLFVEALTMFFQCEERHMPRQMDEALLRQWFDIEISCIVLDLGGYPD